MLHLSRFAEFPTSDGRIATKEREIYNLRLELFEANNREQQSEIDRLREAKRKQLP